GVTDIMELPEGELFIATDKGLFIINTITDLLTKCVLELDGDIIEDVSLLSFLLTDGGELYLGTEGNGLIKIDHTTPLVGGVPTYKTKAGTSRDGLPNNVVYRVHEDSDGNIWGSTNQGVFKFEPTSGTIEKFDIGNGLASLEHNL